VLSVGVSDTDCEGVIKSKVSVNVIPMNVSLNPCPSRQSHRPRLLSEN
jgi:hypothetical protein